VQTVVTMGASDVTCLLGAVVEQLGLAAAAQGVLWTGLCVRKLLFPARELAAALLGACLACAIQPCVPTPSFFGHTHIAFVQP
jgi:hypothetical protein